MTHPADRPFNINDFDTLDELADAIEAEPIAHPSRNVEQVSPAFRQWFLDTLRGKLPEQQKGKE